MLAAPYDFRLPPSELERRDGYFSRLRSRVETAVYKAKKPVSVLAHSLGNNIFMYFVDWMKHELGPKRQREWFSKHVDMYVASGPPALGSAELLKHMLSGTDMLPTMRPHVTRPTVRSWGSLPMMSPRKPTSASEAHSAVNGGGTDYRGPGVLSVRTPDGKVLRPATNDLLHGTLLTELGQYDSELAAINEMVHRFYHADPEGRPLEPWLEKPPIKNIVCAYGVNVKTEVGYEYSISKEDGLKLEKSFKEHGARIVDDSGKVLEEDALRPMSGDGTVPYYSLSWCFHWLGKVANITYTPTQSSKYDKSDVKHYGDMDVGEFQRTLRTKDGFGRPMDAFFEAARMPLPAPAERALDGFRLDLQEYVPSRVAIWEFEGKQHQGLIRDIDFLLHLQRFSTTVAVAEQQTAFALATFDRQLRDSLSSGGFTPSLTAALDGADFEDAITAGPASDEFCVWDMSQASCSTRMPARGVGRRARVGGGGCGRTMLGL
jgi:hypothetical protein